MDANADNVVSLDEFLDHMAWVSQVLEDDKDFATFIQDTYNITVEVSAAGAVSAQAGFASREEALRAAFAQLDRDGSGYVDKEELKAALSKLHASSDGKVSDQAAREIDAMDSNADSKLSLDEFMEHVSWMSSVLDNDDFFRYLEVSRVWALA